MLRSLDGVYRRILEEPCDRRAASPRTAAGFYRCGRPLPAHRGPRRRPAHPDSHVRLGPGRERSRGRMSGTTALRGPRVDLSTESADPLQVRAVRAGRRAGRVAGLRQSARPETRDAVPGGRTRRVADVAPHGDNILLIHGVHTPFLWFGVLVAWRGVPPGSYRAPTRSPRGWSSPMTAGSSARCAGWITRSSAWRCVGVPASWCSPRRSPRISRLRFPAWSWRGSAYSPTTGRQRAVPTPARLPTPPPATSSTRAG